jgi:large subunit ribosomal protein L4
MVSGGGRKPFKQKGTGRARAGTTRAPHWRGGGVVFGPVTRDHGFKLNKKVRAAALRSALSRRSQESAVYVLDAFDVPGAKTAQVAALLTRLELTDALIVLEGDNETGRRSARNLPGVTVVPPEGLNVYDILNRKAIVMTKAAAVAIDARLGS